MPHDPVTYSRVSVVIWTLMLLLHDCLGGLP
jgi:hypothetical protein